ncbi:LTA synthase family protein [Oceanobacillus caeni]|uniref:LTA synthase family protein n=1 Tax=Oceanobacillus caeni TaxID=405946 RepID=UPI001FD39F7D|nr:LTA synthase family protein [Oceanobacillus caeni]
MNEKRPRIPLYITASLLFGIKTYIVYRFMFNIELDNSMQEFILFINPFVSAFVMFAISVWFNKPSRQMKYIRYTGFVASFIVFANLVFYRQFTDFITIPQLFMGSNMADLGSSILTLIKPYDFLLFIDTVLIWVWSKRKEEFVKVSYQKRWKVFVLSMSMLLLAGNFLLAEMERPQLFTRGFDREYLVKNIGLFNYHIYDIVQHSKAESQRVFADGNELNDIKSFIDDNVRINEKSNMFGAAEGKNVIWINAESLQSFVIKNELNGEEVTPFLNSLIEDEDTYYFENFYEQTGQGKTSDSEFLVENSMYPLSRGAVFFTHSTNEYHATPEIIKDEGYNSAVLHANSGSFWNRFQMYDSIGFDHFYDENSYEINPDNSVGWGLKDKPFFEQSIKHLQSMDKPFYAKLITLTNHFPFELGEEDRSIEPYHSNSNTLNNYFPAVRYMDEAIEEFFTLLESTDLYENSIIVIMGDHIGISANHNKAMSMYLDKEEITPYDQVQLQRVPLLIHIPGDGNGKTISTVSGQIDIKPTILSLLGIDTKNDIYFGNDLFAKNRKSYIALRNGDFISNEFIFTAGTCYNRETGEIIEEDTNKGIEKVSSCNEIRNNVETELQHSDDLIYGDLLRFYDFD